MYIKSFNRSRARDVRRSTSSKILVTRQVSGQCHLIAKVTWYNIFYANSSVVIISNRYFFSNFQYRYLINKPVNTKHVYLLIILYFFNQSAVCNVCVCVCVCFIEIYINYTFFIYNYKHSCRTCQQIGYIIIYHD